MTGSTQESGQHDIEVPLGSVVLEGALDMVPDAGGLVLFVHGSGSSRFSSRNRYVAQVLRSGHLSTLLFDLLSPEEEEADRFTGALRFDIELLTQRVVGVTSWLREREDTQALAIGYFGASTGAAAALAAAAQLDGIGAVVSRGGRPDLVGKLLPRVTSPTLLIVGGRDTVVIDMNEVAFRRLQTVKEMKIVPGATHLFEEPGALEEVASLATAWFQRYLTRT
jgi:putative phosphoribosyl transferase